MLATTQLLGFLAEDPMGRNAVVNEIAESTKKTNRDIVT
jgi:hypothetical protein